MSLYSLQKYEKNWDNVGIILRGENTLQVVVSPNVLGEKVIPGPRGCLCVDIGKPKPVVIYPDI